MTCERSLPLQWGKRKRLNDNGMLFTFFYRLIINDNKFMSYCRYISIEYFINWKSNHVVHGSHTSKLYDLILFSLEFC